MNIDFGRTSQDYARYRAGFPQPFYTKLREKGLIEAGMKVLDLGTGTGVVARSLAEFGCVVTGVDISQKLLDTARRLDGQQGVSVDYAHCAAENSLQPDSSFGLIIVGQAWHWFTRPRVASECFRILVPGGSLIIAHFDWLPQPGNVVTATEELILKYNSSWQLGGGTGVYPQWFADISTVGFTALESWTFDMGVPYSHEAWRGRIRASAGVAASLNDGEVKRFDEELRELMATKYPDDPLEIPHRVFTLVGVKPT